MKIEYSTNGGNIWTTIVDSTANTGNFTWPVPAIVYPNIIIRVSDKSNSATSTSTTCRNGLRPILTVSDNTALEVNQPCTVSYTYSGPIKWVKGAVTTASLSSGYNSFETPLKIIVIPPSSMGNQSANISLYAIDTIWGNSVTSTKAVFVNSARTATILSPNGGEQWPVGSLQNIKWSSNGTVPTINLQYSTDGGKVWKSIASGVSNTVQQYNWTVPDDASNKALLRISIPGLSWGADSSNATFSISGGTVKILKDPESTKVTVGSPVTFTVTALGINPLTYQWQKNSVNISGATSPTFTIAAAQLSDAGKLPMYRH